MEQQLLNVENAIRAIEHDPNCDRIKKLMAYACSSIWNWKSSEPVDFGSLILQLLAQYPTPEALQAHLHSLVSTLNKTAEYTLVANTISSYLADVYTQHQSVDETTALDYASVAQQIQNDPDALRIKKLLFCACGHPWENDPVALAQLDTISLVSQMRHIAPTMATLSTALSSIVATLNRAQIYEAIAHRLAIAFTPLYEDAETLNGADPNVTDTQHQTSDQTELLEPSSDLSAEATFPFLQAQGDNPPCTTAPDSPALTVSMLAKRLPRVQLSMTDLYDLRLEVMKYTTPLRAKVLLFSTLRQQTEWTSQDYAMLKTTDLSALLKETFQTYKHLEQLRPHLRNMAAQLTPTPDYLQACGAILRAIAPWYETGTPDERETDPSAQTTLDASASLSIGSTNMQFSQGEITETRHDDID